MLPRERFKQTINHQNVDRAPMDLYGTTLTSCLGEVTQKLLKYYSLNADTEEEAQMKIQKVLDIDFRRVGTLFEPQSDYLDYSRLADGEYTDSWGIIRRYQGMYWDIVHSPFKDKDLKELQQYRWPSAIGIDKKQIEDITDKAKRLFFDSDYVVVAEHPVYGFLELGCWIFGFDDFLYRLLAEPETVEWFFKNYYSYVRDVAEIYYGAIGEYIHVTTSGDDFGMQNGLMISPDTFRETIKPWYAKRISLTKQMTDAKYFHHTCGSVYRLLDEIIDMGVDILNPIQPGAFEMEPERLKSNYGEKLVFWGGIDEQGLLSTGTPQQVTAEVRKVHEIMNQKGGWVMSASHNIQPDVPTENIIAMFNAFK